MQIGAAFNRHVVLRVCSEQVLIALSHGFRIINHTEYRANLVKNGTSTPTLIELSPASG